MVIYYVVPGIPESQCFSLLIKEPLIKSQNTLSRYIPGQASQFWRMPESSQNNKLLDAGRFGLHVLSRHFLHPVGRIHQHDGVRT